MQINALFVSVAGMENNTTLDEADPTQEPGDTFSLLFLILIGKV
jgi:hypothetical protein